MRILIVGCGCRGQALASELIARGHVVRGTTRDSAKAQLLTEKGIEAFVGDPDRVGTLMPALPGVTVVCWLMGSAVGDEETVEALHTTRLEMALERVIDTGVRGFVYEAEGTVPSALAVQGAGLVEARCGYSRIPHDILNIDPKDHEKWLSGAISLVEDLISTK